MANNSPETVFRIGLVNASVLKNVIEPKEGSQAPKKTVQRRYYDEKEDKWESTTSFQLSDPAGRDPRPAARAGIRRERRSGGHRVASETDAACEPGRRALCLPSPITRRDGPLAFTACVVVDRMG